MNKTLSHILLLTFLLTLMTPNHALAKMLKPHLYEDKLDNGLTMLVKETPGTKAVTVQIWVKAGSIYEDPDEAGITHLIEHMIFKGTDTMGAGELAAAIEGKGGRINAYTSYEYTVYHATLAARYWETAMDVLTDSLLHSTFDPTELDREKPVVLEELHMRNDQPRIKLFQALMRHSYRAFPYRRPVIGSVESVSSFTRGDILSYIKKHYVPANFTVVVVGDVEAKAVMAKVRDLYGALPARQAVEHDLPAEPAPESATAFAIEDDVNQAQLALTLPIGPFADQDTPVIDVIAGILGNGDASRLYNRLRNKQGLVYSINASAFTPLGPGLFEISAVLDQDKIPAAIDSALTELYALKYAPVDEDELARVKLNVESDFVYNLERVEGQARVLGSFYMLTGDPTEDGYLDRVRAVTREDIMRVANRYFTIKGLTAGSLTPRGKAPGIDDAKLLDMARRADQAARARVDAALVADAYLSDTYRYHLDNGITLLVREEPTVPTVAVRAVFPGGLRAETEKTNGAFAFISDVLPRGTAKKNARQMALALADMAGDISGFNGKNTFGLKASFLDRYLPEGLALVHDVITTPAFDPKEVEKVRPERIAVLRQQEDSLPSLAFREFNRVLFKKHPYALNTAGSEAALAALGADDLRAIYQRHARPENLVLAVAGKVKAAEVYDEVKRLFGGWQPAAVPASAPVIAPPAPPASPEEFSLPRDKEQVHIVLGFLGADLHSPDRFALEVADTILSGQSGRLFRHLRDEQSLAYSLSAFSMPGLDTGAFGVYIGTSPDKVTQAIESAWRELERLRETPVAAAELERAKNVIIGQYELNLQTHGSQAMEEALDEIYGLGQDFGSRYVRAISEVSAEDVMAAAQKYIQPDHYVLVKVGVNPGGH